MKTNRMTIKNKNDFFNSLNKYSYEKAKIDNTKVFIIDRFFNKYYENLKSKKPVSKFKNSHIDKYVKLLISEKLENVIMDDSMYHILQTMISFVLKSKTSDLYFKSLGFIVYKSKLTNYLKVTPFVFILIMDKDLVDQNKLILYNLRTGKTYYDSFNKKTMFNALDNEISGFKSLELIMIHFINRTIKEKSRLKAVIVNRVH